MDIEHDFLVDIHGLMKKQMKCHISLSDLRTMIESMLRETRDITITL